MANQKNNIKNPPHRKLRPMMGVMRTLIREQLWAKIITGMLVGILVGIALSPDGGAVLPQETALIVGDWLALPGRIFLSLIQMIVVALVASSIVLGVASNDMEALKRIGLRAVPYFILTTMIATVIGISLTYAINPGDWIDQELVKAQIGDTGASAVNIDAVNKETSVPQQIAAVIPTNPLKAAVEVSMFHIVVFAILMGAAIASLQNRTHAKILLDMAESILSLTMTIVGWAMLLAPLAVFGLLAQVTIKIGLDVLMGMGVYVLTAILGLLIMLAAYGVILTAITRRNPFVFLGQIKEVMLLAFSTSSSAAVIPLSLKTAEETMKVSPSVARFVIPLGATVNMAGTALYQVVATIFLTQVFGIDLTMGQLILLIMTTVGASIGTPSAPGSGIVVLATILQQVGVPIAGVALVLGVDRIIDMARTAVNVTGDLVGCTVVQHLVRNQYPESVDNAETLEKVADA